MRNRALRMVFDTQENLTDAELARVGSLLEVYGWLVFLHEKTKESEFSTEINSLPVLVADKNEKTPSQKLRNEIYKLWKYNQYDKQFPVFDDFYRRQMDMITNTVTNNIKY